MFTLENCPEIEVKFCQYLTQVSSTNQFQDKFFK